MRRNVAIALFAGVTVAALVFASAGPLMSDIEQPAYTVERADGAIELRAYPPMQVASTAVEGSRGSAVSKGFRILADYIFGANADGKKIEMTAPVMQQDCCAASSDRPDKEGNWKVRFVMPRGWSKDSLPKPNASRVTLETMPAATFVVIRFSGFWRDAQLQRKSNELRAYIARNQLISKGAPIYAFYNPPWTLPFFRRNEVMIELVGR